MLVELMLPLHERRPCHVIQCLAYETVTHSTKAANSAVETVEALPTGFPVNLAALHILLVKLIQWFIHSAFFAKKYVAYD